MYREISAPYDAQGMDDGFGHWLAGFIDGEGCFCISATCRGRSRMCSLNVALRSDDKPLLVEIQERTGLGKIYDSPGRGSTKPYTRWVVQTQVEAQAVVSLFTRYPLRGKKAQDFTIWAAAVEVWCSGCQGNPSAVRWPQMDLLKARLQAGRVFA